MTLKEFREIKGYTQSELAEAFQISKRTVQNWEYRDCCPEYVVKLLEEIVRLDNEIFLKNQEISRLQGQVKRLESKQ